MEESLWGKDRFSMSEMGRPICASVLLHVLLFFLLRTNSPFCLVTGAEPRIDIVWATPASLPDAPANSGAAERRPADSGPAAGDASLPATPSPPGALRSPPLPARDMALKEIPEMALLLESADASLLRQGGPATVLPALTGPAESVLKLRKPLLPLPARSLPEKPRVAAAPDRPIDVPVSASEKPGKEQPREEVSPLVGTALTPAPLPEGEGIKPERREERVAEERRWGAIPATKREESRPEEHEFVVAQVTIPKEMEGARQEPLRPAEPKPHPAVERPVDQPAVQSAVQPASHPALPPVAPLARQVARLATKPASGPATEPAARPTAEPSAHPKTEPVAPAAQAATGPAARPARSVLPPVTRPVARTAAPHITPTPVPQVRPTPVQQAAQRPARAASHKAVGAPTHQPVQRAAQQPEPQAARHPVQVRVQPVAQPALLSAAQPALQPGTPAGASSPAKPLEPKSKGGALQRVASETGPDGIFAGQSNREKAVTLKGEPETRRQEKEVPDKGGQTRGVVVANLHGDLKLIIKGDTGIKVSVRFREYPKTRRKKAPSRQEFRREQNVLPVLGVPREDTREAVIEAAREGVYSFSAEPDGGKGARAGFTLKVYEGGPRDRTTPLGTRTLAGKTVLFKILMPEAILWDDESAFTGSMEDSDSETRFNAGTGLYWKEYKD